MDVPLSFSISFVIPCSAYALWRTSSSQWTLTEISRTIVLTIGVARSTSARFAKWAEADLNRPKSSATLSSECDKTNRSELNEARAEVIRGTHDRF